MLRNLDFNLSSPLLLYLQILLVMVFSAKDYVSLDTYYSCHVLNNLSAVDRVWASEGGGTDTNFCWSLSEVSGSGWEHFHSLNPLQPKLCFSLFAFALFLVTVLFFFSCAVRFSTLGHLFSLSFSHLSFFTFLFSLRFCAVAAFLCPLFSIFHDVEL